VNLSHGPVDMDATTHQVKVPDAQRSAAQRSAAQRCAFASPKAGVYGGEDQNPIVSGEVQSRRHDCKCP
jgi:hypothetical protein